MPYISHDYNHKMPNAYSNILMTSNAEVLLEACFICLCDRDIKQIIK